MNGAFPDLPLCVNCRFYQGGVNEEDDTCMHPHSTMGGVRAVYRLRCISMRIGACGSRGSLFEAKQEAA